METYRAAPMGRDERSALVARGAVLVLLALLLWSVVDLAAALLEAWWIRRGTVPSLGARLGVMIGAGVTLSLAAIAAIRSGIRVPAAAIVAAAIAALASAHHSQDVIADMARSMTMEQLTQWTQGLETLSRTSLLVRPGAALIAIAYAASHARGAAPAARCPHCGEAI